MFDAIINITPSEFDGQQWSFMFNNNNNNNTKRKSRNTGVSPFSFTILKCPGFFYVHYTTHGTYSFTSHPKDEAIIVKCLAQGNKCHDRPGRDSNPHSGNTRTWVQCTTPLSHDMCVKCSNLFVYTVKFFTDWSMMHQSCVNRFRKKNQVWNGLWS